MNAPAATITHTCDIETLMHALKTLNGAAMPRQRSVPSALITSQEYLAQTLPNLDEEAIFRLLDSVTLSKEPSPFQSQLERVARGQRLFHYVEKALQSGEIAPQTADFAWTVWTNVDALLSRTLPIPDASYGPEGQFLFLWDREEHHLELEIEPGGVAYFFYRDRTSGAIWDSDYQFGETLASEVIEKLRIFA